MSTHHKKEDDITLVTLDEDHVEPIMVNPKPANLPILRQLGIAFLLLFFVLSTSTVGALIKKNKVETQVDDITVYARLPEAYTFESSTDPFDSITIAGKSAFVWDIREQRILYEKDSEAVLPLASITKLMTALVAYELLDDDAIITISSRAVSTDGDSGLKPGETFSLRDLTDMVLLASSNDGAAAIAEAAGSSVGHTAPPEEVFIEAMNLRAEELGLTDTVFKNTTGLDISPTEAGAYSTARDVATLLEYIVTHYPEVTSLTANDESRIFNETGEYHEVRNTNTAVSRIDGLLASKTGYTELAGGNLAVAFESGLNRPIIVVVLGSTFDARFTDVEMLSEGARAYVTSPTE